MYIKSFFKNLGQIDPFIEWKHPSRCHPYKKRKQNEIVSNLNKPDEINESTVINLHPISSQARRNTAAPAIFCKHLKEVKDPS